MLCLWLKKASIESYANCTVSIADDKEDMQGLLNNFEEESRKKGL